jgi:hypothetical protein
MPNDKSRSDQARQAGWNSSFPEFVTTPARIIRISLEEFVRAASSQESDSWADNVPRLQTEVSQVVDSDSRAPSYSAILEYQLPLDSRRADAVFLVAGAVVVIELKGKSVASQADVDQAAAYARDLCAYHSECRNRPVHAVLVATRSSLKPSLRDNVWVTGPEALDQLLHDLCAKAQSAVPDAKAFLEISAYCPLPTLVQAARELFDTGDVRPVWRARALTDEAVSTIAEVAREAARTRTRHLVLVTGVPGSGKTLVGMRTVHAHYLDDLAISRDGGKPTVPALFLSGNDPLVKVLQHVLRGGGGGGKTFVRGVKDYLDAYVPRPTRIPPEHLLVFDEAQRAFSADMVLEKHKQWPTDLVGSEPDLFIRLCERMPEWSVIVALLGTGQEIHRGEEGGVELWRDALFGSSERSRWTLHAPAELESIFNGVVNTCWRPALNLDTALRFHLAADPQRLVASLLGDPGSASGSSSVAESAPRDLGAVRFWVTRDLDAAKQYLRDRYHEQPDARFGLLASSRDKLLVEHGVDNSHGAQRLVRVGAWFADPHDSPDSCCRLHTCLTEFQTQGLELDMALVAWGADLRRANGVWDSSLATKYQTGRVRVSDPNRLRLNAYRVLLTRGRDGTVVFVPPERSLDETWSYLLTNGFRELPG